MNEIQIRTEFETNNILEMTKELWSEKDHLTLDQKLMILHEIRDAADVIINCLVENDLG